MSTEFYWIAVVLTTVVSAARFARLGVIDKFPPVKAVRTWYENKTDGSDWQWLALCVFCFSLYPTAAVFGWGLLAGVYGHPPDDLTTGQAVWWIVNGLFALTYLSAMTVLRDGAVDEDD